MKKVILLAALAIGSVTTTMAQDAAQKQAAPALQRPQGRGFGQHALPNSSGTRPAAPTDETATAPATAQPRAAKAAQPAATRSAAAPAVPKVSSADLAPGFQRRSQELSRRR